MKYFLSYLVALTVVANNLFVANAFAGSYKIQNRSYVPLQNIKEFGEQNQKTFKLKEFAFKFERHMQTDEHLSVFKFIDNKNAQMPIRLSVQDSAITLKSGNKLAQIEVLNDDRIMLNGVQIFREDTENNQVLLDKVQKVLASNRVDTKFTFTEILLEKLFPSAHAELGNNDLIGIGIGAAVILAGIAMWVFGKDDDKTITKNLNINYKDNTPRPRRFPRYIANYPYGGTSGVYDLDEEDFEPGVPETAVAAPSAAQ